MVVYFIQAGILFTLCWLFEKLILDKDRSFIFRRIFVLAALIIIPVLPFVTFPQWQNLLHYPLPELIFVPEPDRVRYINSEAVAASIHFERNPVLIIYWTGVLAGTIFFLANLAKIGVKIFRSYRVARGKFTEINDAKVAEPYSFFNYINLGRFSDAPESEKQTVLTHELIHVRQFHSLDNLVAAVVSIFFWFIPPVHFLRSRLQLIHEYIADDAASEKPGVKNYCLLLVRETSQNSNSQLFNRFYFKPLKKRIMMMMNKNRNQNGILKKLLLLPFLLLCFATLILAQQNISEIEMPPPPPPAPLAPPPPPPVPPAPPSDLQRAKQYPDTSALAIVDEMPRFYHEACEKIKDPAERNSCAQAELFQFVTTHLDYPENAQKKGKEERAVIQFVVEKDGSLSDIKIVNQTNADLGNAALKVVRFLAEEEKFVPGRDKGALQRVKLYLPVSFRP